MCQRCQKDGGWYKNADQHQHWRIAFITNKKLRITCSSAIMQLRPMAGRAPGLEMERKMDVKIHPIQLGMDRCYLLQGDSIILIDGGGLDQAKAFLRAHAPGRDSSRHRSAMRSPVPSIFLVLSRSLRPLTRRAGTSGFSRRSTDVRGPTQAGPPRSTRSVLRESKTRS